MKKIQRSIIVVMLFTIICKVLGFLREIVLAYYFGATKESDTYLLAGDILSIFFFFLFIFAVVFVPIYNKICVKKSRRCADNYTITINLLLWLLSCFCVVVSWLWADNIVSIVANGLGKNEHILVVKYLKIMVFSLFFSSISDVLIGYLNSCAAYEIAAVSNLPVNIIECAAIIVAGLAQKPFYMAFGVILGNGMKFLLTYIGAYVNGFTISIYKVKLDSSIKETLKRFVPVFFSSMLVEINTLIDKSFASFLPEGSITMLNYGAVTRRFIFNLFSVLVLSIFYPKISLYVEENKISIVFKILKECVEYCFVLVIPISVFAILYSDSIINLIFGRGKFIVEMTDISQIFSLYCFGILFMALNEIFSKTLYSFRTYFVQTVIAGVSIIFNFIFNYIFVHNIGVSGLALATSFSQVVVLPIYIWYLRKKVSKFNVKQFSRLVVQIFFACIPMSVMKVILLQIDLLSISNSIIKLLFLLIIFFVNMLMYCSVLLIIKNDIILGLYKIVQKNISKIKKS